MIVVIMVIRAGGTPTRSWKGRQIDARVMTPRVAVVALEIDPSITRP